MWLRGVLPQHHLDTETKDLIKLGVALIGTMSAMLLGLLVASAKSAYDAQRSELTQMAADTIWLIACSRTMVRKRARRAAFFNNGVAGMLDRIWGKNGKDGGRARPPPRPATRSCSTRSRNWYRRTTRNARLNRKSGRWRSILGRCAGSCSSRADPLFPRLPGGGGFLAQHAFRQLRIVRAAQCDCVLYPVDQRSLGRRRVVSDPGALIIHSPD